MDPTRKKAVDFIEEASRLLQIGIDQVADRLTTYLIQWFAARLTITDGNINTISANFDVVNDLGQAKSGFFAQGVVPLLIDIADAFFELEDLNREYFSTMEDSTIDKVIKVVTNQLHLSHGIKIEDDAVKIVPGGWLSSVGDFKNAYDQIREEAIRAVSQGVTFQDFQKRLKEIIEGTPDLPGLIKAHFRTIVWDVYAEYDRSIAWQYASRLGYKAAIYEGGLIDRSRDFCIARDGKVFTLEEIRKFGTKEDEFGGYSNKELGLFDGKPKLGYDPIYDQGGYQCRHAYSWIPDRTAIRLRPELKTILSDAGAQ